MKVLVACEFSGRVRDAFIKRGHDAISCDLLPTESPGPHIQDDIQNVDLSIFDLKIAHPPCTLLCRSGARWWKDRLQEQEMAIHFFMWCVENGFNAIENPIGIMSTMYRKPDQIIQPWMFGVGETKATCLWLRDVPRLVPTNIVNGRYPAVHYTAPGINRSKIRSVTCQGIADAMAEQWG